MYYMYCILDTHEGLSSEKKVLGRISQSNGFDCYVSYTTVYENSYLSVATVQAHQQL